MFNPAPSPYNISMNVRICGAGAIGTVVAWKLNSSADVSLIVDEGRAERYKDGLIINGERLCLPLLTPDKAADAGPTDLLIVAVKNFSLDDAIELMRPFVSDSTAVLSLLNGIESEGKLSAAFGEDKVLYGLITGISSVHEGLTTTCLSGSGIIIFGEKDNSRTERVERFCKLFQDAGQAYKVPENIHHDKWWKFMLNSCFNTISAILNADYASIYENRDFIRVVRIMAKEIQAVARAEGVILGQDDVELMIKNVTSLHDHGKTSMLQDVLAGRETENRYFAGAVSRFGKLHGIPTPANDMASILLEARRNVRDY